LGPSAKLFTINNFKDLEQFFQSLKVGEKKAKQFEDHNGLRTTNDLLNPQTLKFKSLVEVRDVYQYEKNRHGIYQRMIKMLLIIKRLNFTPS
jgi:hypothetical protein